MTALASRFFFACAILTPPECHLSSPQCRAPTSCSPCLCSLPPAAPGPGGDTTPDAGAVLDATVGDPGLLVGGFQVKLVAPEGSSAGRTAVIGKVYDGPSPAGVVWEERTRDGDCALFEPRVPICDTACTGGLCVEDQTCQLFPTGHEVGTVHVTGIATSTGATSFDMKPVAAGYQPPAGTSLPFPGFAEGDAVVFTTGGGYVPSFRLEAAGIAPLELLSADANRPHARAGDRPRLDAARPRRRHDDPRAPRHQPPRRLRGQDRCQTDDDGAITIGGELIGALLALGAAGQPTIIIDCSTVSSTVIAPAASNIVLSSEVQRPVTVPGIISCGEDDFCPDGLSCQPDLTCQ